MGWYREKDVLNIVHLEYFSTLLLPLAAAAITVAATAASLVVVAKQPRTRVPCLLVSLHAQLLPQRRNSLALHRREAITGRVFHAQLVRQHSVSTALSQTPHTDTTHSHPGTT